MQKCRIGQKWLKSGIFMVKITRKKEMKKVVRKGNLFVTKGV